MKYIAVFLFCIIQFGSFAQNEEVIAGFYASELNNKVLLSFSINLGYTCNGVIITRSEDALNFSPIGSIEGICGSTQEEIHYEFTDIEPVKNAVNYYRLDLGGVGFSQVMSVEVIDLSGNNSIIRPNPISEETEIHFDNETNSLMSLAIYTSEGIWVETKYTLNEMFILKKSDYKVGSYFYLIRAEGILSEIKGRFIVN